MGLCSVKRQLGPVFDLCLNNDRGPRNAKPIDFQVVTLSQRKLSQSNMQPGIDKSQTGHGPI